MSSFSFWQKWLFIVGLGITVFGIIMALLSGTPLFELFHRQIDPAFWGTNAVDTTARQFQQWIYGVWGATVAGWGILVTCMAHHPFSRKEKWARDCIVLGLIVWFVLDTSLSAIHGVHFNIAFNASLLILVMLPVIFTHRHFR